MNQSLAVWLVILLALGTASLPFLLQRPLLVLPWSAQVQSTRQVALRILESIVHFGLLAGWCYATAWLVGGGFLMGGDASAVLLFLGRLLLVAAAAALLLAYPGWRRNRQYGHARAVSQPPARPGPKPETAIQKPFIDRLIEVLVLYVMVGTIAFSFEANIGNPFQQEWGFYAITLCLYLVLAYPGFVLRYLFKQRRVRR